MIMRSVLLPFLIFLMFAAALSGCTNEDASPAINGPVASSFDGDQNLLGTWHHDGFNDGLEFTSDGRLLSLSVDAKGRLQIDRHPDVGSYNVPRQGQCIVWWNNGGVPEVRQSYTYVFAGNSLRLTLIAAEDSEKTEAVYLRKAIGDVVR